MAAVSPKPILTYPLYGTFLFSTNLSEVESYVLSCEVAVFGTVEGTGGNGTQTLKLQRILS
jgi:hypothetical protein